MNAMCDSSRRAAWSIRALGRPRGIREGPGQGGGVLGGGGIALDVVSGRVELMLGVVTALIGAPFFFYLVLRERWRSR